VQGKKQYDKRATERKKEMDREASEAIKTARGRSA
jgi:tmRNA-binding protein